MTRPRIDKRRRWLTVAIAHAGVLLLSTIECALAESVTFNETIGPLVYRHCASCHHEGAVAPFALVTYRDCEKRADQLLDVIESGYMPPWLPVPQKHEFSDVRRLTAEERAQFAAWVNAGTPEGPGHLEPPTFSAGWPLGPPDRVLSIQQPFPMHAEGAEVFRNFVLPVSLDRARWVAAFDFRPQPFSVVHHGVLQLDSTGRGHALDDEDELSGYSGMENGRLTLGRFSEAPEGQLLGWLPGKVPSREPELAWLLKPNTDIILQLHLQPQGKAEMVTGEVALYFSDQPPPKPTFAIFLANRAIDIAPGEKNYHVKRSYTLPVDVDVRTIYPHAHYICREMNVTARRPDGTVEQLLRIDDWNFYWQDDYTYAEPIPLEKGTVIEFDFIFDNSAENVRNPFQPPQRITWGEKTTNEMANVALVVVPKNAAEYAMLRDDCYAAQVRQQMNVYLQDWQENPRDGRLAEYIGEMNYLLGEVEPAIEYLEAARALEPNKPRLLVKLSIAYETSGQREAAAEALKQAAELAPTDADVQRLYGQRELAAGNRMQAREAFTRALEAAPHDEPSLLGLSRISWMDGDVQKAIALADQAVATNPKSVAAWEFLGLLRLQNGERSEAKSAFATALTYDPKSPESHAQLGNLALADSKLPDAVLHFRQVINVQPNNYQVWDRLGVIAAVQKDWPMAETCFDNALKIAPSDAQTLANLGRALQQQQKWAAALDTYEKAVEQETALPATLVQFARLLAAVPDANLQNPAKAKLWIDKARKRGIAVDAQLLDTAAIVSAAEGEFDIAVKLGEKASTYAAQRGQSAYAREITGRVERFRQRQAYVESR